MKIGCLYGMSTMAVMIIAFIVAALITLLTGCTTTKYVPVEKVRTDTVLQTTMRHDSIYLRDSIYATDFVRGDTVWSIRDRWHTQYVERKVHDTTYVATHDTIPQPYPVEVIKTVEKSMSWWQRLRMDAGNIALALLAFAATRKIYRILRT